MFEFYSGVGVVVSLMFGLALWGFLGIMAQDDEIPSRHKALNPRSMR